MAFSLIEKLYANRPFEEDVKVLGRTFRFKILTSGEEDEALRSASANSFMELIQSKKVPTLARAIISIDGEPLRDATEIKQRLASDPQQGLAKAIETQLRTSISQEVIDTIFQSYVEFQDRYKIGLDETVKKSSQPVSAAQSG